jgi:D-glycero-D-manno-heptose 1,7-bisphosphate phosphatase
MNKAVFLDRDGTLNVDAGYTYKTGDLRFFPDVFKSLKLLLNDFKFFIITNQSGIGRGYYTKEDFQKFNDLLVSALENEGIMIEKTYCCPHRPEDGCDCRKPNKKFIDDAKNEFDIDLSKSFVIGDHPCDVEMGQRAGCKSIHLLTGHGQKHKSEVKADFVAKDLYEAAGWILNAKDRI